MSKRSKQQKAPAEVAAEARAHTSGAAPASAARSADVSQHELDAMRPNHRPLLIAVLANVLLAALCLGVPYYRGKVIARASIRAFGSLAACVFDGEQGSGLGLVLPAGERTRFAARVMRADASWPHSCSTQLDAVAPEDAVFLWPSVKTAGGDVRASVDLVRSELHALERARAAGETRVPARPLLAIERLRAALTLLAQATSVSDTIDEPAIRFDGPSSAAIPDPARLPLGASPAAPLDLTLHGDGIEAVALDGRGLSWLAVEGGSVARSRVKRSSLVRGVLRGERDAYVVWAMAEAKCDTHEQHCANRAMGVAPLDRGATGLSEPAWLGAHPAARIDRSMRITEPSVHVLARASAEGALELRRFELDGAVSAEGEPGSKTKPRAPLERIELPEEQPPLDALLLQGPALEVAYVQRVETGITARLWQPSKAGVATARANAPEGANATARAAAAAPTTEVASLPTSTPIREIGSVPGDSGWLAACTHGEARMIAFGSAEALAIARVAAAGVTPLFEAPLALGAPLDAEDRARDRVRMACAGDESLVLALDSARVLHALRCGRERCDRVELARNVAGFDVAATEDAWLLAWSGRSDLTIGLVRLRAGQAPERLMTPGACWDPEAGMCGQPALAADRERIVLVTREGSDLRALESHDGGASWQAPASLRAQPTPARDATSPLDQHRLRKGLEK